MLTVHLVFKDTNFFRNTAMEKLLHHILFMLRCSFPHLLFFTKDTISLHRKNFTANYR